MSDVDRTVSPTRADFGILALFASVLCFSHIWGGTLAVDGIRYAAIAKNIVESGDYRRLYDAYAEAPYYNKPPLLFWITALSFKWFGYSTGAAKLVGAVCAAASIAALWLTGVFVWGSRVAAYLGVLLLASSPIFFRAVVDLNFEGLVLLGSTCMLAALLRSVRRDRADTADLLLYSVGGALLLATKPPYLAFPALPSILVFRLVPGWRALRSLCMIGVIMALGTLWYPFVEQSGYLPKTLQNQLVEPFELHRSLRSNLGRWGQLLLAHFAPVTLAAIFAIVQLIRKHISGPPRWNFTPRGLRDLWRSFSAIEQVLVLWALPIIPIVGLATVRPRYVLVPSLALILLGSRAIEEALPRLRVDHLRWAFGAVSVVVLGLLACAVPLHKTDPFVTLFREQPALRSPVPPLCISDGGRGDVEAPTQRRLEMLLDFEFGILAKAYGATTIPKNFATEGTELIAESECLRLLRSSGRPFESLGTYGIKGHSALERIRMLP